MLGNCRKCCQKVGPVEKKKKREQSERSRIHAIYSETISNSMECWLQKMSPEEYIRSRKFAKAKTRM